jgi:hypothetical protein
LEPPENLSGAAKLIAAFEERERERERVSAAALSSRDCGKFVRLPRLRDRVGYYLTDSETNEWTWRRGTVVKVAVAKWPDWFEVALDTDGERVSVKITLSNWGNGEGGCWQYIEKPFDLPLPPLQPPQQEHGQYEEQQPEDEERKEEDQPSDWSGVEQEDTSASGDDALGTATLHNTSRKRAKITVSISQHVDAEPKQQRDDGRSASIGQQRKHGAREKPRWQGCDEKRCEGEDGKKTTYKQRGCPQHATREETSRPQSSLEKSRLRSFLFGRSATKIPKRKRNDGPNISKDNQLQAATTLPLGGGAAKQPTVVVVANRQVVGSCHRSLGREKRSGGSPRWQQQHHWHRQNRQCI